MKQPMPANLSGMKPPAGAQTTAGRMAGPSATESQETGEAPTPQEQAAYDAVVKNAASVVHSEKFSDTLAKQMMDAPDKARVMGRAVGTVMARVMAQAQKQGAAIPAEVIIPATQEVYELVAEIGDRIGAIPPGDEQMMTRGWMESIDATRVALVSAGIITQEQAQAEIPEMQAEDRGGAPAGFNAMRGMA